MVIRNVRLVWRILRTGLAFALIFGGGAIIAVTAFPLMRLVTTADRGRGRFQYVIHLLFRGYVWLLQALRLLDLEVIGRDKLRTINGRMIVANHPSLLDVVVLMALVRRTQCIVKKELWDSWALGRLVRGVGFIRNDLEPEAMLYACRASLAAGENLIIFPEGTRSVQGEPLKFRRGFANLATLLQVEIQLITITCAPPTLVKGENWWKVPTRRPLFRVHVGDVVDAKSYTEGEFRSIASRRLVRDLEGYYAVQLGNG